MNVLIRPLLYISLLLSPLLAQAGKTIAGIELADSYTIKDRHLALNGAGIRSKLFVKVYVGAIYLAENSRDSNEILAAPGPKSMQMTMLYKEVEAQKITRGWTDGFRANLTDEEFSRLDDRLRQFNGLFPALRQGDTVHMDYSPQTGTRLSINQNPLGIIEGEDFMTALLKVWIGEHPADKDLKRGLLGH